METADARSRIDIEAENLFRRLRRDFLDIHAAFGGGDEGDARGRAIDKDGEVKFTRYRGAFLDIEAMHFLAFGARLMRDERRTEKALGLLLDVLDGFHHLDAAGLAAAACMDLRLDDPHRTAEFPGLRHGFFGSEGRMPARHRHTVLREYGLGLVFVNIHEKPSGWRAAREPAPPKEKMAR